MVIAPDDTVRGRSDELKNVRAGDPSNPIITFDDLKVRIFGNTAVVSGIQRRRSRPSRPTRPPQAANTSIRFSAVLVKHDDRWRMELLHLNRGK
jgi:ketosteroid isomerase-like protein